MTRSLITTAILATVITAAASAQEPLRMTLRPDSKLTLEGGSNVHDWACKSTAFEATVDVDPAFLASSLTDVVKPIAGVQVRVPIKSLTCGHRKMDENMYKALKADAFPDIRYTLTSYDVDRTADSADAFTANTKGELTVSGKTIQVEIPIKAVRQASGATVGEGKVQLKMTDFGISPPVALLGALRTKNEIEIAFRVLLEKSVVVALLQP